MTRALHSVRLQAGVLMLLMLAFLTAGIMATTHVESSIEEMIRATGAARLQSAAAQQLLIALQDAETGQRGYLLTDRPAYLEPFYAAVGRIGPLVATLQERTAGLPGRSAEANHLADLARRKVDELQRTVALAQRSGREAAMTDVLTDVGQQLMDEARASAGRIIARAEQDRATRAAALQRRQSLVTDILLGTLVGGVLLLGMAALVLLFSRARLKDARLAAQREAARLAAAIDQVPDGVAVFDAEGRLTMQNARFAATLAVRGAARPGAHLDEVAAEAALEPPLLNGARPARPQGAEARQGTRTLEVWRGPMPDGGELVAVADLTRRVAAEEVARQAQKMEVLGQMTGGVAHDFNNLLQVVSANLELLRQRLTRGADPATLLPRLDAASAGVARGARLTRHLLAFARRQPLAPEPLDAARLLMGMEEVLRRTVGEAVQLELVVGGGLWLMRADPTQFENAILNLALNARDAMAGPDGTPKGKLTIEAANAALDEDYAARSADVTPGQYVMFAVTDTGSGMTPADAARALEPFYTTKPEGQGTGLGLPMVLGFAKQSGGHFGLYSEVGRGTTARLYIPRTLQPLAQRGPMPDAGTPRGSGELVLLVEDDQGVRAAAGEALLSLGYQVIEADTAEAGLRLLEAGAKPRLLFTDVVMPGAVTARELADAAVRMVPGIGVLFTSGYTQNSIVHNGQLDPGVVLISKPWRTDALARALQSVLDGAPTRQTPRRRVLLVEDEDLVRMTTADALAELGFDVVEAPTAAAALARLQPPPDLLVTDLGLPDQDGLSLVQAIRGLLPGLPVVVVSGQAEPPDADVTWLPKPYDVAALRQAVHAAVGRAG